MQRDYFDDFKYIRKAKGAKTLSYNITCKDAYFSKELKERFLHVLKNHESRFRISLHTSPEEELHDMIIGMRKGSFVYPHKHQKSESYHIIEGKVVLVYFDEDGNITDTVIMSKDDTVVARADKESYHALIALSDTIYHECRIGPFVPDSDSVFAPWCKENKEHFMNDIMNKIG